MEYLTLNKLKHHFFTLDGYYSFTFEQYDMPFHSHNNYEIMYVNQGTCKILIIDSITRERSEVTLFDNQFILLNAGTMHRLIVDAPKTKILNLEIKAIPIPDNFDFFPTITNSPKLNALLNRNLAYYKFNDNTSVQLAIQNIHNEISESALEKSEQDCMLFYQICELFVKISRCTENASPNIGIVYLKKAAVYISENYYLTSLSILKVAEQVSISPSYLQRLFKMYYKMTVLEFINKLRITKAANLILNSNMSINMIYEKTGFSSRQHFNKNFLKYLNMTPTEFKKQNLNIRFKKNDADTELLETELLHPNYI